MRILYIATSFPEPHKGATIYTDLAEALFAAGHEITVAVTEQAVNLSQTQINNERGFEVLRVVTGNYYDVSLIEKGITTLKIPYLMKRGIIKFLSHKRFDFILYESPPVTNASIVSWAKKVFNCPSYLMLKDIFPQNAIDLGIMKRGSLLAKFFAYKEKILYKSADVIGCMSEANRRYILDHNPWIGEDKIELFPNTKKITDDIGTDDIDTERQVMRNKYSIPNDACVFLFGGNMGKPQYVDLLIHAIVTCKNEPGIFFALVGRGTERYRIEETIKTHEITNARVIENIPRSQYEQFTKACDVGLIVLDPRFSIPNYPSRILSYMEYSKPVIAATDKSTDLNLLIENSNCGEWIWSGDKEGFVDCIKRFSTNSCLNEMGNNGRKYIENHFSVSTSVQILEEHFKHNVNQS